MRQSQKQGGDTRLAARAAGRLPGARGCWPAVSGCPGLVHPAPVRRTRRPRSRLTRPSPGRGWGKGRGDLALGEGLDDEAHVVGEEEERPALARRPCPSLSSGCGAGGAPRAPVAYCTFGDNEAISNAPRAARRARLVSRGGSRRPPRRRIAAGIDRLAGTPARAPPTAAARPS